jgi:hypothetical protein
MSISNRLAGAARTAAVPSSAVLGAERPRSRRNRLGGLRWLVDAMLVASLVLQFWLAATWVTDSGWWAPDDPASEPARGAGHAAPAGSELEVVVSSQLTARGDLVVSQVLEFDDAVRALPVSVRPASIGASDDVATEVRDILVTADDRVVSALVTTMRAGDSTVVDLGGPARSVRLDYLVAGAVEPSEMSAPGRAVVDLNPVHILVSGPRTLVVEATAAQDGEILSMACGSRGDLPTPCGRDVGRGWSVRLSGDRGQDVIASVDMPRA